MIERFLLPDWADVSHFSVDEVCRSTLDSSQDLDDRKDFLFLCVHAWSQDQMYMIVHDDRDIEFITNAMVMEASGKNNVASQIGQRPAKLGDEGDEMGSEIFLQVREVATVELHGEILALSPG